MTNTAAILFDKWRQNDLTPNQQTLIQELQNYKEKQELYSQHFKKVTNVSHLFNLNSHTYGLGNDLDRMLYYLEKYIPRAEEDKFSEYVVMTLDQIIKEGKESITQKLKSVDLGCLDETDDGSEEQTRERRFLPDIREFVQQQGPTIRHQYLVFFDKLILPTKTLKKQIEHKNNVEAERYQWIKLAVRQIVEEKLITKKYHFIAIYKIISEKICSEMDLASFYKLIDGYDFIPEKIRPSSSSLYKIAFRSYTYPKWQIEGFTPQANAQIIKIAKRFLELYKLAKRTNANGK